MTGLSQRNLLPEVMDQPELDPGQHRLALDGLSRINYLSRSAASLWPSLRTAAVQIDRPLRVLDLASGAGDVAIRLWQKASQAGVTVEIEGVDVSPLALDYAREAANKAGANVRFRLLNAVSEPLPGRYDAAISCLFLHHLDEHAAIDLLRKMAAATSRVLLISDLRRSRLGYVIALFACRVLTTSRVVHTDGPRSVANAFSEHELRSLFELRRA